MAVPEFNEIKAPALQFMADGKPHRITEVYTELAKHFALTDADLAEMLPSGTQSRWHNRANWACYDLFRAGLLDRPKRGVYIINQAGRKLAEQKPERIDREILMQFPQFAKWVENTEAKNQHVQNQQKLPLVSAATPNEVFDAAYDSLHATLKAELLELIRKMDPFRFERLVLDLLLAMGYGGSREEAAQIGKGVGDEGIDGLINEDRLGLDRVYVQAKRWQDTVGRPPIQNFVGALAGQHASKGIFITTSEFSKGAVDFAKSVPNHRVILIDGKRLAELMIEHNVGVSRTFTYEIKRVDSDYFDEE